MAVTDLDPLDIWRRAMVANVRRDAPDLSARQMAVLLTVYMTGPPHTVRGLAEVLNVSKPAITRAIDRLGEFGLARRKTDPRDRRSVIVQRTVKGSVYLAEFAEIINEATVERERDLAAAEARQAKARAKKAAVTPAKAAKPKGAPTKTPKTVATAAKKAEQASN
ncbi:MAG: MarR family transcriptional regulator [Alphaproteobacteria bacterium]|nr:MarR family transcriptional regulator [Alphaproteobacteria bacterium]